MSLTEPTVAVTVTLSARFVASYVPSPSMVPVLALQVSPSTGKVAPYWSYPVAVNCVVDPGTIVVGLPFVPTVTFARWASRCEVICVFAGTAIWPMTFVPS